MLGGVLSLGSQPGGTSQLQALLTTDDRLPESLALMLEGNAMGLRGMGQEILGGLFGGKLDSVIDSVANTAGAKPSAVSSLLTLAAPLIMSGLGRLARSQGLSASDLVALMAAHKEAITNFIPPSLTSLLGLPGIKIPNARVVSDRALDAGRAVTAAATRPGGLPAWWPWALGLGLLLLLGISYGVRSVP